MDMIVRLFLASVLFLCACGDGGLVDVDVANESEGGSSNQEQGQEQTIEQKQEDCLVFVELADGLFCELPNGDLRPIENELE